MRTENKNSEMMQALFEHFYNQKSLLFTIGGLLLLQPEIAAFYDRRVVRKLYIS